MTISSPSDDPPPDGYKDPAVLRRLYIDEQLTTREIGALFDVAYGTIGYWLDKYDIENPWRDAEILRELYHEEMLSMREMSARLGCSLATIKTWMNEHGIDRRSPSESVYVAHNIDAATAPWKDPDVLYEWVFLRGYDPGDLAERWDVTHNPILTAVRTYALGLPGGYEPDPETTERLVRRVLADDDLDQEAADALDIDIEAARLQTQYANFIREYPHETIREDGAALRFLYEDEGLAIREIAALYDVSMSAARDWLIAHDIDRRSGGKHSHDGEGDN